MKYKELSANTVAFISCRCRLTKVLAGTGRGEKGSKGAGGQESLLDLPHPFSLLVSLANTGHSTSTLGSLCSSYVYRHELGRYHTLPFFLTFFYYFQLSQPISILHRYLWFFVLCNKQNKPEDIFHEESTHSSSK